MSPVAGSAPGNSHEGEGDGPPPLTAADFQIDVTGEQATVCPAGHPSIEEYELKDAPERVKRPRAWALAGARGAVGCGLPSTNERHLKPVEVLDQAW